MVKRRWWWIGGGLLGLLGIGGVAFQRDTRLGVQVAQVRRETITAKVNANGKIQAVKKVDISANIMGQVTRLAVKEGDVVRAGDFLLEIDPERAKAAVAALEAAVMAAEQDLATARARLSQARSDAQRAESNRAAGIVSQADYEQFKTALQTAEAGARAAQGRAEQTRANLREARVSLAKTVITAPMDGVVTARRIEQGETAVIGVQNQPGTVLLTISDMSKVEAELEVDEASIPDVRLGQRALVRIDAYPNRVFEAVVTEVGGSPLLKLSQNEATKFKVKVQLQDPPPTIKPGLSAQAEIFTGRRPNALAIPLQALVMKDVEGQGRDGSATGPKEEEGVFLLDNGTARFRAVKTGLLGELKVEVLDGLREGETIVTGPFRTLRELKGGERLRVETKREGASSPVR